jgi:hypothetical protein
MKYRVALQTLIVVAILSTCLHASPLLGTFDIAGTISEPETASLLLVGVALIIISRLGVIRSRARRG